MLPFLVRSSYFQRLDGTFCNCNYIELGRIVELIDALEAMAKDNQQIPQRAMILSRKYRTLVSSWIEPLQEEAELGHEVDYIAR